LARALGEILGMAGILTLKLFSYQQSAVGYQKPRGDSRPRLSGGRNYRRGILRTRKPQDLNTATQPLEISIPCHQRGVAQFCQRRC
jgi:hypothetical protein